MDMVRFGELGHLFHPFEEVLVLAQGFVSGVHKLTA
jgi:hypothetical protein